MGKTKELIGYNMEIKNSFGGFDNQFIYQDELDSYEPPKHYKITGIHDVYEEPNINEFTYISEVEPNLNTDGIITGRYGK